MPRRAPAVVLTPADRAELERRVRARTSRQQDALRARIVLLAAAGRSNTAVAQELGIARHTAQHWRTRFLADGLAGLRDRPHCPPPRRYGPAIQAQIVLLACRPPAEVGWEGQTHWTLKDLATYIGEHKDLATYIGEHLELGLGAPSKSTVHTILRAHDVCLDRL